MGQSGELDKFTARIDSVVPELLARRGVPGAAIGIVRGGEVAWAQGYGLADRTTSSRVTEHTVFQAASLSKPVTAWGVMRLVERGKLELDEPVDRYLTRWHLPPSEFNHDGVTVRRLLSHTAGLSLRGYPGVRPEQALPTLEESLTGAPDEAPGVRVVQEPGTAFSYSGGGYTLLQMIVEEVCAERFSAYMQREILDPLEMHRSSFDWAPHLRPVTATGHDVRGRPLPNYLFAAKAAAGLFASVMDLGRFVAAGLTGGNGEPAGRGLLSPATLELIFSPSVRIRGIESLLVSEAYGLGYAVQMLADGNAIVLHGGSNRGWRAQFAAHIPRREGIVALANSDAGMSVAAEVVGLWAGWIGEAVLRARMALARTGSSAQQVIGRLRPKSGQA